MKRRAADLRSGGGDGCGLVGEGATPMWVAECVGLLAQALRRGD